MCAIAGTINFGELDIEAMKQILYHRGPDRQNSFKYNNINLIHTRLSIQDIDNGHQPFIYGDFVIIFNGEIYNHIELRKKYLQDFTFTTNSDTQTLLYMYIKYKNKMFDMLDGMFAFVILDKKENRLVFARDRAGKKPLYLYKDNEKVLFASELNAVRVGVDNLEIDEDEIYSYMRNGFFFKTNTPYKDVSELEAGYIYELDCKTLELQKEKYFDILDFYKKDKISDLKSAKSSLDDILHKSIKDRLLSSDLEVGAFLSGGIDSGLIVAIASKYTSNLKTFTVKFDGIFDESQLAKLTAKKYNTQHYELDISIDLKNDVEKILLNYGEPFMDSSAIPSYYVSKEAKKYVTVVLNGDGADELFGGYRRYIPIANSLLGIVSYFSYIRKILPKPHKKQSLYNYIYRLLAMSGKRGISFYNSATNDIFEDIYSFDGSVLFEEIDHFLRGVENEKISSLSKMLYMDFNLILQSDLLKKMDIATMAHSLEGRSPFLSKYLLEFAPTLADRLKIKGMTTKYLLRELAKNYLPLELICQPKRGFEVPLKKWIENDLKENIFDSLFKNSYSENFIDRTFILDLLEKKVNISDEKRAKILWTLYSLEIWKRDQ